MIAKVAATVVFGLSLVSAAPWAPSGNRSFGSGTSGTATAASSARQTPFKFPLDNGFPNIDVPSSALSEIEKLAHGTLPNGPLPSKLAPADIGSFKLIAFNEIFEVAFFTSLIHNITHDVPGFEVSGNHARKIVLDALVAIQAQEELHAIGANAILKSAGAQPIQPCHYVFPSADFDSAIKLASTFTDLVLGTLQDAQTGLGANGDSELIALLGSVIGQEGEQNGFYRTLLDLQPSQLPFLTRSTGPWAFSALNQMFIVNGSCPSSNDIPLPIFGPLTLDTQKVEAKDQNLKFTFQNNGTQVTDLKVVYQNQQNQPVVENLKNPSTKGDMVTFEAFFPFDKFEMNGLTIAVLTDSAGPFASADDVAAHTVFGPALIDIN